MPLSGFHDHLRGGSTRCRSSSLRPLTPLPIAKDHASARGSCASCLCNGVRLRTALASKASPMVDFLCNFIWFPLRACGKAKAPDLTCRAFAFLLPQRSDQVLIKVIIALSSLFTSGVHAPLSAKSVENSSHLMPLGYAANNSNFTGWNAEWFVSP